MASYGNSYFSTPLQQNIPILNKYEEVSIILDKVLELLIKYKEDKLGPNELIFKIISLLSNIQIATGSVVTEEQLIFEQLKFKNGIEFVLNKFLNLNPYDFKIDEYNGGKLIWFITDQNDSSKNSLFSISKTRLIQN